MEMIDRIHNEVNLACMKENPDWDGKSFDYGCSCYQSAFKAYKSMYDDGHSGYSWGVTANILWRLIHDKPLTPIEDTPDVWHKVRDTKRGGVVYQCDRMPSLFKEVDSNDHITYTDHDRVVAIYNGQSVYGSMCRDVDKLYLPPVTMPYYPSVDPYILIFENFCTDGDKMAYDTYAYLELRDPKGNIIIQDKYFKVSDNYETPAISKDEYEFRKQLAKKNGYFDE